MSVENVSKTKYDLETEYAQQSTMFLVLYESSIVPSQIKDDLAPSPFNVQKYTLHKVKWIIFEIIAQIYKSYC